MMKNLIKKQRADKVEEQSLQEKEEEEEDDFVMDYSSEEDDEQDNGAAEESGQPELKKRKKKGSKKQIKQERKNGKKGKQRDDSMDMSNQSDNNKKDDKQRNKSEIWNDFLNENKQQLKLFKVIERQMLSNFKIPECAKFIPSVEGIIQNILEPSEEYRKVINDQLNDQDLQHYLNKCKEDLYKQLVFQYRDQVKASVHLDWVKSAIRSASEQLLGCEKKNHNLQKDIIWFHILITFSSKLLRESDDESFDFQHRVSARISYLKVLNIMCLILQIESTEFAIIFKKLFE